MYLAFEKFGIPRLLCWKLVVTRVTSGVQRSVRDGKMEIIGWLKGSGSREGYHGKAELTDPGYQGKSYVAAGVRHTTL